MIRVFMLLLAASAGFAQTVNTPWARIFNGKDLAGWVKVGNERWEATDGAILGQGTTGGYGYIRTEKKYKDFELSLRFRCDADINSGVFFHTDFIPGTADVSQGLQFEIDTRIGSHTAGIYGDGREWVAWPSPENETVVRQNDWNDLWVKVDGSHYSARLNGVLMLDFTDPKPKSFDGFIALQLHSGERGEMRFKDVFLRDLTRR